MNLTLKVWRQKNREDKGRLESYNVSGISEHAFFLEIFDVLNEQLITEGKELLHSIMTVEKVFVVCVLCI